MTQIRLGCLQEESLDPKLSSEHIVTTVQTGLNVIFKQSEAVAHFHHFIWHLYSDMSFSFSYIAQKVCRFPKGAFHYICNETKNVTNNIKDRISNSTAHKMKSSEN